MSITSTAHDGQQLLEPKISQTFQAVQSALKFETVKTWTWWTLGVEGTIGLGQMSSTHSGRMRYGKNGQLCWLLHTPTNSIRSHNIMASANRHQSCLPAHTTYQTNQLKFSSAIHKETA